MPRRVSPSTHTQCARFFLRLSVAMTVCCSCPCCETIRGHIRMLKSPCVMPAEHRDISVCRTMTILSLLSQGISYPKVAKVTPCKCNMLSYWGLQAFITAVFFIRDMQQVSCDCIGYHHTYIPQHHPAPAFTAPAIPQAFPTIIIQRQLSPRLLSSI